MLLRFRGPPLVSDIQSMRAELPLEPHLYLQLLASTILGVACHEYDLADTCLHHPQVSVDLTAISYTESPKVVWLDSLT